MEQAIGLLLQYVAMQQTQLQSHEERLQRMAAQVSHQQLLFTALMVTSMG